MPRLNQNKGKYQGECIDIHQILREIHDLALQTGWEGATLSVSESNHLPVFRHLVPNPRHQVYISSGIHGDEPAGPLAVLKLFQENAWPAHIGISLVPCLNPAGYTCNTREDEEGVDLNRDYRSLKTPLVRAHIKWLNDQPRFEVALLLHEDWESNGFYLYELNPTGQPSLADAIIQRASQVCPIDTAPTIEGRTAHNGIITANADLWKRPDWPEAFYIVRHKAPVSYTLEAPSDFELSTRVAALVASVHAVLETLENRE